MKIRTIYLLLIGVGLVTTSCYEDKSTLQTTEIPTVTIEVPEAIATELSVVQGTRLELKDIRISKAGVVNPEGLNYKWSVSKTENDAEASVLADTPEFHEVIDLPISSAGYLFVLTVTDPQYGLEYQHAWTLYVTSQYGEGLVVAYTADGVSSDLALIMHPKLTDKYSGAAQGTILKDLIKEHNEKPFPSPVSHLLYTFDKQNQRNILWVSLPGELMRIATDEYKIVSRKEDLFIYPPQKLNIEKMLNTYQCTLLVNDGDLYETLLSFEKLSTPNPSGIGMSIDNNVISAHAASSHTRRPSTLFYDKKQGKFCYGYNRSFFVSTSVETGMANPGAAPGLHSLAGGISVDGSTHTLLMQDEKTTKPEEKYRLYTFTNQTDNGTPKVKFIYTIPSEANAYIEKAVSLFFSLREPILYITTKEGIYKLIFEAGAVKFDAKPVFQAPAGEQITLARLYLQGAYAMENYEPNATLAWSSRAVVVVTSQQGKSDKIRIIPQINFGSGQLDSAQALSFDGFGKITDFTVAGLYN